MHELFFQTVASPDSGAAGWRVALADRLRGHSGFVNLLRVLDGRPRPLGEVMDQLRPSLPVSNDGEALLVLNALCALISVARRREGNGEGMRLRPFLRVGLHLWVRELRRMVCSVRPAEEPDGARYTLRHSDDLAPEDGALHLPLVQCRECHRTGWGAVKRAADRKLDANLHVFYNRFFARDVDVVYLFPDEPPAGTRSAPADETDLWLGLPCLDLTSTDAYDRFETPEPTWFGRLDQRSGVRRALRCRRCCLG